MTAAQGGDFAKKVVQRLGEVVKDRGSKMADQWGDPIRGQKLTRDQQVRLWNMPNPQADPAMIQQLIAAGQHGAAVDQAYPWRRALIGRGDIQTQIDRANSLAEQAALPPEVLQ